MKRLIVLIMTFILVPQFAFASQVNNLKAILDDYTYSMTVEWDQKDLEFSHKKSIEMEARIRKLLQNGLSREEIREVFGSINTSAIETEIMLIDTANPKAVSEFLIRKRNEAYAQGSHWLGQSNGQTIALAVILAAAAIMLAVDLDRQSKQRHSTNQIPRTCTEYTTECHDYCEHKFDYYTGEVVSEQCWEVCDKACAQ